MISKFKKVYQKIQKQIPECGGFVSQTMILLDFIRSKLKFHVSFEEYRQYAFYKLRDRAKKEYITEHDVLHVIPAKFNNSKTKKILDDKASFNEVFKDLLGRDFCVLSGKDAEKFINFTAGRKQVMIKPTDSWCGNGVQKCDVPESNEGKKELFEALVKDYSKFLVEEYFQQYEQIMKLNPDTVNSLRIISISDDKGDIHIPFAAIRIGRKGSVVDNFCAGGMSAVIDIQSGMVVTGAYDGVGREYLIHPDTGLSIIGQKIPEWDALLTTIKQAAMRLPEMRLIGWDAVIRNDGKICLLEGNSSPGARTIQMPLKRGIKPEYQKYLGRF